MFITRRGVDGVAARGRGTNAHSVRRELSFLLLLAAGALMILLQRIPMLTRWSHLIAPAAVAAEVLIGLVLVVAGVTGFFRRPVKR